jgi:peptidoglycan hydrolase CwlO-like protein
MSRNDRMEILALVEGQVDDIYKELDAQMKRMAQLQAQIDEVRATIRKITGNSKSPLWISN